MMKKDDKDVTKGSASGESDFDKEKAYFYFFATILRFA